MTVARNTLGTPELGTCLPIYRSQGPDDMSGGEGETAVIHQTHVR